MEFDDEKGGSSELRNVKDQPDLLYIAVLRQDGSSFFRHRSKGVTAGQELIEPVTEQRITDRNNALHVSMPLRQQGRAGASARWWRGSPGSRSSPPRSRACGPPWW